MRRRFPVPPSQLPALEPLLDGGLWSSWAERGWVFPLDDLPAAVRYVRLKPHTSCRLLVFGNDASAGLDPPPGFVLQLYPDRERARLAFDKISNRKQFIGPLGYEPFIREEHAVVAVPFPNDSEVPGLRHVYRRHRLRQALTEILDDRPPELWTVEKRRIRLGLLAYKPGRRAVYRVDVPITERASSKCVFHTFHMKVENRGTCERSYRNLVAIHGAVPPGACWSVPAPRGRVESRSMIVTEWVDGQPLASRIDDPGRARQVFRATGRALGELHAVEAGLRPLPASGDRLSDLSMDLARMLPDDARAIETLGERLSRAGAHDRDRTATTVHGDFHLDQVLLVGDRPVLVDFDRAGLGDGLDDIGSFCARLEEERVDPVLARDFLEGHAEASGCKPESQQIRIATAVALFYRCGFPFRSLDPNWPEAIRQRMTRIDRLLDGDTP